jgi:hypothetical protein
VDRDGVLLGPVGERPGPSTLAVRGVSIAQLRAGSSAERRRLREGLALLALVRRDGVADAEVTVRREGEAVVAFGGWRLHVRTDRYEEQWRRFWQVAERIPAEPRRGDRRVREVDLRFANSVVVRM